VKTWDKGNDSYSDPGLKERVGARKANEVLKFESSHLDLYRRLLDKEQIPCDFHITTAFDLCLNDRMAEIGRNAFHERQRDWPEDMKAFLEIEGEEHLERLSQAKDARWGCAYKVGSVHPYKLVNGVLRRCFVLAKNGGGSFNLQTHTPVTRLDHSADGWTAVTERGNVTAPKVVVCANGYVSHLLPEFANKIIPLKGACSALAIPPVQPATTPSNQVMRPLFTTYSLKHDEHDFDYMISRQEFPKHIVVGGGHQAFDHDPLLTYGNTDDTSQMYVGFFAALCISHWKDQADSLSPGTEAYFKAFMPKHFVNYPEPESRLAHLWTGGE
jgi:glycine/D-amino acid oxidase-like deaminating enzyme